jgi:hypothetical protein
VERLAELQSLAAVRLSLVGMGRHLAAQRRVLATRICKINWFNSNKHLLQHLSAATGPRGS